ncbi:glycosyltransferase involved in cell wall biosynthesis [Azorhizobium sp. AG788]|uniref:glycosyltransferase n=1 Tax=Azorhizobium sp. AG788 TaxID=2183897 RepID=UPI001061AB54|nr:glycosyltransferase [Azorhizobium sp. AG788]TDU00508.1 glycosyltransferase involved in cell wall biosynthesis [Azorhizobium sp. AG788]
MSAPLIAHIIPWTNLAGTELATLRLAEAARRLGYGNVLYLPEGDAAAQLEALCRDHRFETARFAQPEVSLRRPWPYLAASLAVRADFRRRGVRIVHAGELLGAYFTAFAGRLAGARVISHVRADHPQMNDLDRLLLRPVQHFLYVSKSAMGRQDFPLPPGRGTVLYDAAPPAPPRVDRGAARAHYGLPAEAVVFGMPARVSPQKDHATLIRAMAQVRAAGGNVHVLIVGDTDTDAGHRAQFAVLSELMQETGTGGVVHFAGFEGEMARFYGAIDGLVLSTHTEGFPLVLLEAMSAALPVIATNVGGIPEAVADRETGLLVPHEDAPALAGALLRLAGDAPLRSALGEAGRQRAESRFGASRFERELASIYARLLEPARP